MTTAELKKSVLELATDQRQEIAAALWQSLENDPKWLPDWQRQIINERLADSASDPGESWEAVKAELWPKNG